MNELVSVIIPVYNVEKYLERCVRSVMAQTYTNLEIILVDDGSPDNCGKICDNLASQDNRIKVIHKENGGVSDARNRGIKESIGQYVTFIDSDDFVSPEYVEYLYDLLNKNGADISCCGYVETNSDLASYGMESNLPAVLRITGRDACIRIHSDLNGFFCIICAKLYKREIIEKYSFPVGRRQEDEAVACCFLYEASSVVIGARQLYAYYRNANSYMCSRSNKFNEDAAWAFESRARFFEEKNEIAIAQHAWNYLFYYYLADSWNHNGRSDNVLKSFAKGKKLSIRTRFELGLYNMSPSLHAQFLKIKRILGKIKAKIR